MGLSRRDFLVGGMVAGVLGGQLARAATPAPPPRPPVCVFSKHLQFLDYASLAKTAKELGLDGVDLTVREGGHVEPGRVAEDLPRAVATLRGVGIEVPMITTRFKSASDSFVEDVMKTASQLGIKFFRVGGHKYDQSGDPMKTLDTVTEDARGLADLAAAHGMVAGYHNHSGFHNVGAPVWDLKLVYDRVDSPHLGANYDLGHATVEGGYGDWQITTRAIAPYTKMIAVKDFQWRRDKPEWVPLGKGVVRTAEMLAILREAGFQGPISLHFEYRVADNEAMIGEIREAVKTIRSDLAKAGYTV